MRSIHQNQFNTPLRFEIHGSEAVNALVVAVVASLASFLNRRYGGNGEPPKFSWFQFAAHLSASIISALLSRAIAIELGVKSDNILTVIAGIAGWAGVGGVNWLIYAVKMRALMFAGLNKAAERERFNDPDQIERTPRRTGYSDEYDSSEDYQRANGPYRRKREAVEKDNENIPKD